MSTPAPPSPTGDLPSAITDELPAIIHRAGTNAVFAAQEFFFGKIRNEHTRRAYQHAVKQFLAWIEKHGGGELTQIAPWQVGQYFEEMKDTTGIATRNQHLSALRHFFDGMVTRHAIPLNPALSVRDERYSAIEGKTPGDFHRPGTPAPRFPRYITRRRPAGSRYPCHPRLYKLARGSRRKAQTRRLLQRGTAMDAAIQRERRTIPRNTCTGRSARADHRLYRFGRIA